MREILFRGKLLSTNEWTEGNLAVSKTGVTIITPDDTPLGKYGQVDPETVGQFTGVTDKRNRKVFEDDILLIAGKYQYRVYWCNERKGFYVRGRFAYDDDAVGNLFKWDIEIVGNIYDLNFKSEESK